MYEQAKARERGRRASLFRTFQNREDEPLLESAFFSFGKKRASEREKKKEQTDLKKETRKKKKKKETPIPFFVLVCATN